MAKILTVKARKDKFRRCGIQFGAHATVLKASDFTDEQLKTLLNERELVVVESEIADESEADPAADADKGKKKKGA